jgi:thiamine pyrophosphate-dependent acetolactate synthase large subunit-like protein
MAIKNVADLFVATLEQAGVKRIYGIVGDSLRQCLTARNVSHCSAEGVARVRMLSSCSSRKL